MDQASGARALVERKCKPCEGGMPPLGHEEVQKYLKTVEGWSNETGRIAKEFKFKNYYQTMAFVNAIAWISHQQDHHPDLEVGYNRCKVFYSTHAIGGLSENDFICAAKIDQLSRA